MIFWIIGILVFVALFLWLNNNIIVTTSYTVKCAKNGGFKAVLLSDLHSKSFGNRIYKRVVKINPDVIFITGDLVDDTRTEKYVFELTEKLAKLYKIYYICGNHDHRIDKMEENLDTLRSFGVKVLVNEFDITKICDEDVAILGLDENQASRASYKIRRKGGYKYTDNSKYFNELAKYDGIKIVMSHYPENFAGIGDVSYNQYDFDLMMSGHAHGGQWRFPLVGGLYAPGQGKLPKYCSGEHGDRPKLIISRGLGNSNFPFRIFNFPEICVINFTK